VDERLQDYMEFVCKVRLGKDAKALDRKALDKLREELKRTNSWKLALLTTLQGPVNE